MDLVEAGGVEVLGHIDNTEVVGFQVPSWPPKPRFPATLARFGTVTPSKANWVALSQNARSREGV